MRRLRVGLIGLGGVAEFHLEGYKQLDTIEVVAGAELRQERLKEMVEERGIKGYTDYEEMLSEENLDIACVLTPATSHREITQEAARHGVNVLCEKPMALTIEDARAMLKACERNGVKLHYGSSYRFLPSVRKSKEMIAEGFPGDLCLLMEISVGGQGPQHSHDLGPHHYPVEGPGGGGMGLVDHGIHLIDIFRWFTGSEVEWVFGRGNYSGQTPRTEYLTICFKNGVVGQLIYNEATYPSDMPYEGIFSWGAGWVISGKSVACGKWNAHPGSIRIHGEKGALRIFPYPNKLFFFGQGGEQEIRVLDRPSPANFGLQMEPFANSIFRGKDPEVTGIDGLKALQILLACYQSFEDQRIVQLNSGFNENDM